MRSTLLDRLSRLQQRHALWLFLALGGGLFAVDVWRQQPAPLTPPAAAVATGTATEWLEEEVLYREALTRGLAEGDLIVRRRLAQKMRQLLETGVEVATPDDATLQTYIDRHPSRYGGLARADVDHVFLSRGRRGAALAADAEAVAGQLPAGAVVDSDRLGDPHPAGVRLRGANFRDLERVFGTPLATEIGGLPEGEWQGPLPSGLGLHFVRVSGRVLRTVDIDSVRQRALQDWLRAARTDRTQAAINDLLERHGVTVAPGVSAP
ncbi:peptidyl-prolyl cis-trans isomerase [Flagellatimonas centrodinii]|uniref:peptidylprolyl isomerase n=1 Tax=Flagellatimonas centrodinii TaxID=2806210 RepID=UPI001FEE804D|nr:peptidylprolyl isomerase [Flagellatimonas centrodinii]ULQ47225.1 peptidyl-prolyl cis-trans isomerase [Flagellatimonas centrodinii]